ncbi:MAG: PhnD/SsuA/transferrin family substrate-binding protein [Gammaproteobacteria bacterium]|nr:PhnD/SsuA/transferrin family substrate-binding protein [Gammaproteobacteria bacterium]
MLRKFAYACCALATTWLFPAASNASPITLDFGVYQSDKATVMFRKFRPVLDTLSASLTKTLGEAVEINLKIHKTYTAGQDSLVAGEVDFARFGPASYALAKERNDGLRLIAMENRKGSKHFKGAIIVRKESPYRSVSDLRGARFAFGNERSTIGRYLAQAALVEAGLHATDLDMHSYLDRHDRVLISVLLGDFDAGALKANTFERYKHRNDLRVLKEFDVVTKPWVARANLDDRLYGAIRAALLNLTDPAALKELKVKGFFPASDEDYKDIRAAMIRTAEFDDRAPESIARH